MSTGAQKMADEIATRLARTPNRTTPAARAIRREYSRLLRSEQADRVLDLALRLTSRAEFACRFVAYEIVQQHKAAFGSLTDSRLVELGDGIDSWAAVDCFACVLSGPAWREGRLSREIVQKWAGSPNRWWRRAALVSTVALSRRGEDADVGDVLEMCSMLAADHDDMVAKALSWALRELAKKHPREAKKFLSDHKNSLAARVIREVQNKITTGLKNPRRRNDR